LLIGAPLVSGFASMAGCGDRDDLFQEYMSLAPDDSFEEGFDRSVLTCSMMASDASGGWCDDPKTGLLCASSCQYRGACTGDEALAILFSDDDDDENDEQHDDQNDDQETTCAGISAVEAWLAGVTSGGPTGGSDDPTPGEEACEQKGFGESECTAVGCCQYDDALCWTAVGNDPCSTGPARQATIISIGRAICGPPPASRARKMTDAPPVDASKVHKLAAAMLRSTKTMAHRLAQVAVRQPPRLTPPPPPPPPPPAPLPKYTLTLHPPMAPIHTSFVLPCTSYYSHYVPSVSRVQAREQGQ
jgi:hypothetical protein